MDFANSKNSCGQHYKQCLQKSVKIVNKPRRMIVSKTVFTAETQSCKSNSTGKLCNKNQFTNRPNKTTRSDFMFNQEVKSDYCKSRGDSNQKSNHIPGFSGSSSNTLGKQSTGSTKLTTCPRSRTSVEQSINSSKSNNMQSWSEKGEKIKKKQTVRQYYKNENFMKSSESVQENDKCCKKTPALGTITELSEHQTNESCKDLGYLVFSEPSDSEKLGIVDPDDDETIKQLKQFRNKNYFECHSSTSRIKSKADVTGLTNHKCVYRFYLNDRLFPVPLCSDHNNTIRCVECLLPLEQNKDFTESKFINGSIQAKVRFGSDDEAKDMTLFLPVKENLIIKERRMERNNLDPEVMYFGVVKLDAYGNSVFSQTLPSNSLALRYQKGFRQNETAECCRYNSVDIGEVVII